MSLGFNGIPEKRKGSEATYQMAIYKDGRPIDLILDGIKIREQLELGEFIFIVSSYDYWDGEQTWFNLLSKDLRLLDVVSPFDQNGFVSIVKNCPDGLDFNIYERQEVLNLSISSRGYWGFAPNDIFQRPFRFWLSKRYLRMSRRHAKQS